MQTINGTILDVAPVKTTLLTAGILLTVLLTFVKPEASLGLGFFGRLSFWGAHIGLGFICILGASYLVRQSFWKKTPAYIQITLCGVIGAVLATPFYLALSLVFPEPPPDSWLDEFETLGWWQAVVVEFIQAFPIFLLCWYCVNLPLFFRKPSLYSPPLPPEDPEPDVEESQKDARESKIKDFKASLPDIVGEDIVAISSDLHYLNIHTSLGKSLILGSLKDYADAFGEEGMMVHRSHWVHKHHVVKVCISANEAFCLMSSGLRVPISRSKRKSVKSYFGNTAQVKKPTLKVLRK